MVLFSTAAAPPTDLTIRWWHLIALKHSPWKYLPRHTLPKGVSAFTPQRKQQQLSTTSWPPASLAADDAGRRRLADVAGRRRRWPPPPTTLAADVLPTLVLLKSRRRRLPPTTLAAADDADRPRRWPPTSLAATLPSESMALFAWRSRRIASATGSQNGYGLLFKRRGLPCRGPGSPGQAVVTNVWPARSGVSPPAWRARCLPHRLARGCPDLGKAVLFVLFVRPWGPLKGPRGPLKGSRGSFKRNPGSL